MLEGYEEHHSSKLKAKLVNLTKLGLRMFFFFIDLIHMAAFFFCDYTQGGKLNCCREVFPV